MKYGLLFAFFPALLGAATSCENLTSLPLPHVIISLATPVEVGAFPAPPGRGRGAAVYKTLPAFCRIAATLKPSTDSDIRIEIWMPAAGWNGKLQSVGNGAWAGTISYPAMATALAAGYAAASTDTGHAGNNPDFIPDHPEKVIDFAYRSVHEMTVAAKAIVAAYYNKGPQYSYWNGCSTGGRQALAEAQRFPNDYDGIVAGAPANYVTRLQGSQVWTAAVTHQNDAGYIPPTKYAAIHKAALDQCDALDGVKDGVIEDPTRCTFDPKVLECKGEDGPSCLTAPQVEVARRIYAGPTSRSGQNIFPGLEPGSEMGWATLSGPKPMDLAVDTYKYLVFRDPKWNYLTFNPDADLARADETTSALMNSVNPNLQPLFAHGGKLLHYHGWADPGVPPGNSVNYYKSVLEAMGGKEKVENSYRLFMVPGMGHCGGGDGASTFDMVSALDQWVVQGKAPEQINASKVVNGAVVRTRPLCPYPQVATYKGSGSTDDAANFSCRVNRHVE
ncbi:MAG TPA: tannase/feruloyl esterase family alpha/beta hydrolase [Bryobacteraceae bacterium]|jgi:feruloyl esterase|nr:tannase/feruloyl esterase family alpha/beta hydrolase [Bryobacteraceae bacterium]